METERVFTLRRAVKAALKWAAIASNVRAAVIFGTFNKGRDAFVLRERDETRANSFQRTVRTLMYPTACRGMIESLAAEHETP
jgi:hypothetical protein